MARIAGVTIPAEKQVQIALTYVYGIGYVLRHFQILQEMLAEKLFRLY